MCDLLSRIGVFCWFLWLRFRKNNGRWVVCAFVLGWYARVVLSGFLMGTGFIDLKVDSGGELRAVGVWCVKNGSCNDLILLET